MSTEFEKKQAERRLIIQEMRTTLIISLAIMASVVAYALIGYLMGPQARVTKSLLDLWGIFNLIAVVMIISVLGVRRTIYFSPRLVKDDMDTVALLRKWRTIDIVLLALGETIAILGLVITLMGMPFKQTFHFFLCSFLVTLILMPIPWKVRDKLNYFAKTAGRGHE